MVLQLALQRHPEPARLAHQREKDHQAESQARQPAKVRDEDSSVVPLGVGDDNASFRFQFKFKFFPENVTEEVIQDITLRFLFKQVNDYSVLEGNERASISLAPNLGEKRHLNWDDLLSAGEGGLVGVVRRAGEVRGLRHRWRGEGISGQRAVGTAAEDPQWTQALHVGVGGKGMFSKSAWTCTIGLPSIMVIRSSRSSSKDEGLQPPPDR